MKRAIQTGISTHNRPFEWAVVSNGICYTAAAPLHADGTPETGAIGTQARLALSNLAKQLKAAGGSMADVVQAMLYVTDRAFIDPITEEWAAAFPKPYPNRATVIVKEIGVRGVGMVVMATAHVGSGGGKAAKAVGKARMARSSKRGVKRALKKPAARKSAKRGKRR
ncbi:MAG: RidA family protein [Alphaproteobacteria bacterium]